jgi:hypothetical protein
MPGGGGAVVAMAMNARRAGPAAAGVSTRRGLLLAPLGATLGAPGGGGGADDVDVAAYPVPREELLRNIKRFQARDKYCWSLPVAIIGFMLWCIGLVVHVDVEQSSQVESG